MTLGLLFLIASLCIITILVYWSNKIIERIADTENSSLNEIQEEINENE